MSNDSLKFFFIAILSFPILGKPNSNDSKYIKLLPEGKIREYCENNPQERDSRYLSRVIWSVSNEKELNSMTKAERLAYKRISRFWVHERPGDNASLYDWKEKDYRLVSTAVYDMTLKMKLPAEQTHKEVANVIEMFIKLEKEDKKG